MPEIPIEIVNLSGNAGFNEGIINGNIEGSVRAGITVSADVCNGFNFGLDGELAGQILGNMDILFVGAQAKGEVSALLVPELWSGWNPICSKKWASPSMWVPMHGPWHLEAWLCT